MIAWILVIGLILYSTLINRRWVVPVDLLMIAIYLTNVATESFHHNYPGTIWALLMMGFWIYWLDRDMKERARSSEKRR